MTALLYKTPDGWRLMLAMSDIRGPFPNRDSAKLYARKNWINIRRAANLDQTEQ